MADISWWIKGHEFVHCNCAYGCPCQFNALPTYGNCQAVLGLDIEEGHHGDVRLDGLKVALIASWPGAIHMGGGEVVPILDERAAPEQRDALVRILTGEDTVPGATMFQVFAATFDQIHDPVVTRIEFDIDVEGRRARLIVPGWIDARGEPILNPVSGEEHRARINLPHGFEYDMAEIGRGWGESHGPIELMLPDSHAHFVRLDMTGTGVVHP